jgi:hypothetical protein
MTSVDGEVLVHALFVMAADIADEDVVTRLERELERLGCAALELDFAEAAALDGASVLELQLRGFGRRADDDQFVPDCGRVLDLERHRAGFGARGAVDAEVLEVRSGAAGREGRHDESQSRPPSGSRTR